jgi:hypothetical protein
VLIIRSPESMANWLLKMDLLRMKAIVGGSLQLDTKEGGAQGKEKVQHLI